MAGDDIQAALMDILRRVFEREDLQVSRETTANDVDGWDSFRMVEILMAVEERFGIRLRSKEIDRLKNVGDLADLVEERTGKRVG
jgi:acyl carrier protein